MCLADSQEGIEDSSIVCSIFQQEGRWRACKSHRIIFTGKQAVVAQKLGKYYNIIFCLITDLLIYIFDTVKANLWFNTTELTTPDYLIPVLHSFWCYIWTVLCNSHLSPYTLQLRYLRLKSEVHKYNKKTLFL